jgi:hypothetical protein
MPIVEKSPPENIGSGEWEVGSGNGIKTLLPTLHSPFPTLDLKKTKG